MVVLILFADRNDPDAEIVEVEGPNFARFLGTPWRAPVTTRPGAGSPSG